MELEMDGTQHRVARYVINNSVPPSKCKSSWTRQAKVFSLNIQQMNSHNPSHGTDFCTSHIMCFIWFFVWTWIQIYFSILIQLSLCFVSKSIINDSTIFMTMKTAMDKEQMSANFRQSFLFNHSIFLMIFSRVIRPIKLRLDFCLVLVVVVRSLVSFNLLAMIHAIHDFSDAMVLNTFYFMDFKIMELSSDWFIFVAEKLKLIEIGYSMISLQK